MPKGGGFQMPQMGAAIALPLIFLVLLVSFTVLLLPISPTLRVTFKIATPNQYLAPTIEIVDATYNKASLFATASATKGNITLSYLGVKQGSYMLYVAVSYGGTMLSNEMFKPLGDGTYQIYVAYLPRLGEQASTPYVVAFQLFYSNGQPATTSQITIYPT
jgi:hypothetical protein